MDTFELSVVIATYDRPEETEALVTSLAESLASFREAHDQVEDDIDLIVVCPEYDSRTLSTLAAVDVSELRVVESPRNHAGYNRDRGIRSTSTEYVAIIDSDCLVLEDWFEQVYSAFREVSPDVLQCAGYHDYPPERNWFTRTEALEDALRFGMGELDSRNLIFRRETYFEVGGYGTEAEYAMMGDDPILRQRLERISADIEHRKDVRLYHRYNDSLRAHLHRQFSMGRGARYANEKYPDTFRSQIRYTNSLVPTLLVASVIAPIKSCLPKTSERSFAQGVYFSLKQYAFLCGYVWESLSRR